MSPDVLQSALAASRVVRVSGVWLVEVRVQQHCADKSSAPCLSPRRTQSGILPSVQLRRRKPATGNACAALIGPRVRAAQVRGELFTSDGRPLAAVSRPCLVPYRSPLVRFCRCARSPGRPRRCACQLCTATAMALSAPKLSMCLPGLHGRCASQVLQC